MITGTGIDIVNINRIKKNLEEHSEKFIVKILSEEEIKIIPSVRREEFIAGRFAAKEAIFKAISKNINNTSNWLWKNIEIYNDEKGRPIADISKLEIKNIISQDLSISHIENYAMASFTLILDN